MVRNYKHRDGSKPPKPYSDDDLQEAIRRVTAGEPCKQVARLLHIPHRTLRNHVSGERKTSVVGRQRALLPEEELSIAQHIATFADYGYAFEKDDLKVFVQSFLNKAGRECPYFKDNLPGDDWVRAFINRHSDMLSHRTCQNISRKRAAVSCEAVNKFFDNLEVTLAGVPPENIVNYDETNLSDDPKGKLMLFRKGTKYPERIMNTSKSCVSLMFACSASGDFLPPYTVYKAERLMDTWVMGGPINARYNRSKSGWFDGQCFKDWLAKVAVPYFRHLQNNETRFLIGDNLACHLSADVIELTETNNIKMVFLPANSTHLLQPLDVAVYGPMKKAWRKVLTEWKMGDGKFYTTMPKIQFPKLLFTLLDKMEHKEDYAVSGFRATGIHPLNRQKVINKISKPEAATNLVSPMLIEHLAQLREASAKKPGAARRGKVVQVSPGKSISMDNITAGTSGLQSQRKRNPKRKLSLDVDDSDSEGPDDPVCIPSSEDEPEPDATTEESQESSDRAGTQDTSTGELKEGSYVIVRYVGKKAPYHYVGKVLHHDVEDSWMIQYFRCCYDGSSSYVSFKQPQNPDLLSTDREAIVKILPKPLFVKDRLCFKKDDIGDLVMR